MANYDFDEFLQYVEIRNNIENDWVIGDYTGRPMIELGSSYWYFKNLCSFLENLLYQCLDFKWRHWRSIEKNLLRKFLNTRSDENVFPLVKKIVRFMLIENYDFMWNHRFKYPHMIIVEKHYRKDKIRFIFYRYMKHRGSDYRYNNRSKNTIRRKWWNK